MLPRAHGQHGLQQLSLKPRELPQPVVASLRIPVAEGPLVGRQLGPILHPLERVTFVPLVVRVQVDEQEAVAGVPEGWVELDGERRRDLVVSRAKDPSPANGLTPPEGNARSPRGAHSRTFEKTGQPCAVSGERRQTVSHLRSKALGDHVPRSREGRRAQPAQIEWSTDY